MQFWPDLPHIVKFQQYSENGPQELLLSGSAQRPTRFRSTICRCAKTVIFRFTSGRKIRITADSHRGGCRKAHPCSGEHPMSTITAAAYPLIEIVSEPDIRSADEATRIRGNAPADYAAYRRFRLQNAGGLSCAATSIFPSGQRAVRRLAPERKSKT